MPDPMNKAIVEFIYQEALLRVGQGSVPSVRKSRCGGAPRRHVPVVVGPGLFEPLIRYAVRPGASVADARDGSRQVIQPIRVQAGDVGAAAADHVHAEVLAQALHLQW